MEWTTIDVSHGWCKTRLPTQFSQYCTACNCRPSHINCSYQPGTVLAVLVPNSCSPGHCLLSLFYIFKVLTFCQVILSISALTISFAISFLRVRILIVMYQGGLTARGSAGVEQAVIPHVNKSVLLLLLSLFFISCRLVNSNVPNDKIIWNDSQIQSNPLNQDFQKNSQESLFLNKYSG